MNEIIDDLTLTGQYHYVPDKYAPIRLRFVGLMTIAAFMALAIAL